ncbi:hypothetical protein G3N59_14550 [Paraburkholderia sp. Ac-20340]|uniref:hypothetical protein n=1 Tax=Paraburkholderia sp. Ac-20340 TaxID=2703888 RepID=UPI00197E0C64|nr:hypothetical protein [Paraburkholderia sp. Ac-20340]MBN3854603.1 hypothetical protein [Paraburkholderia sp. Ac-20340]
MARASKRRPSRRAEILAVIRERPGATSAQIAEHLGIGDPGKVTTDMWPSIRSGRVLTERVMQDGRHVNAYYLPDQINGETVTRVNQRVVDANDVIAPALGVTAQTSVFGGPVKKARRTKVRRKPAAQRTASHDAPVVVGKSREVEQADATRDTDGFACALGGDGQLLLIRGGHILASLTEAEAVSLQKLLIRQKLASVFAEMT